MTDNSASPFSLQDICSGLYDVVDPGELYQDGDSMVERVWEEDQLCLWRRLGSCI